MFLLSTRNVFIFYFGVFKRIQLFSLRDFLVCADTKKPPRRWLGEIGVQVCL